MDGPTPYATQVNNARKITTMASIIIRTDGRSAKEVVLEKELTLIGQQDNADINIEDPDGIDERAFIIRVGDDFILDDLGPAGSTLVNGQPVKKTVLKDRDLIVIGHFRMTFQDKGNNDTLVGIVNEVADTGRKSHLVAYVVLGAAVVVMGIVAYQSYVERRAADAQAAKATEVKRSEKEERVYQNAHAIESAIKH